MRRVMDGTIGNAATHGFRTGNAQQPRRRATHRSMRTVMVVVPTGQIPWSILVQLAGAIEMCAHLELSRWTHIRRHDNGSRPRTSTTFAPARGMTWAVRERDARPLRRIPVPGRRPSLRNGVPRIPRRHRHHQCVVVVDALPMPVRGRGLAVDGEPERLVLDDDSVGGRGLRSLRRSDGQSVLVGESKRAIVEALYVEPALVHQPVMRRTQEDEVVERGFTAIGPVLDVMAVPAMGGGAAGEAARGRGLPVRGVPPAECCGCVAPH